MSDNEDSQGDLRAATGRVAAREDLSRTEMAEVMNQIMSGACADDQIAQFLRRLAEKGETVDEVAGAAEVLRRHMTPIANRFERLLDTCGTGGGGSQIFNVSTTAALVIAACGAPVAKHGNRSVTSRSGSADLLEELGVNIDASPAQVQRCLNELGVCFCFARSMHPAMKHVARVRQQLGIRTIFNILGPLSNPAGASHQLLGAGRPELRPLLAAALAQLNTHRAMVVSGSDGLGETTLTGPTYVTEVLQGELTERQFHPEDFGLPTSSLDTLEVANPQESAALVRKILAGATGPPRDIVVLNAAVGLLLFDLADNPRAAAERAGEAIDSQAAAELLSTLAETSHAPVAD